MMKGSNRKRVREATKGDDVTITVTMEGATARELAKLTRTRIIAIATESKGIN